MEENEGDPVRYDRVYLKYNRVEREIFLKKLGEKEINTKSHTSAYFLKACRIKRIEGVRMLRASYFLLMYA